MQRLALSIALLSCLLLAHVARAAEPNTLTAEELEEGWLLLFDGESLYGWEPTSEADWQVRDGAIAVGSGEKGLLCTTSEFADYQLRLQFRAPKETNSGIFLRTPMRPTNPAEDCYELNIATPEVSPFPTGSFVNRQAAEPYLGGDGWRSYDIICRGGQFTVKLDGQQVLHYVDKQPLHRGRIGLQFNSGPVEFRDIKLRPLGLESIFNGRTLLGWTVMPDLPSEFSVTEEGWLHIVDGKGQIETQQRFGDFVLQLEVKVNGDGLNSGVFFRSIPGQYQNGYESQIHNLFKDGDRTQPVDYGTGGFYRRQPARRVVANDHEWFHKTLIVSGRHMATWVNGIQVNDWTDPREPHENPREGFREEPGTIILQGHDPTTDLLFRDLRAGEMPR